MKPLSALLTVVGLTLSVATALPAFAQSTSPSAAPSPTAPNQRRPMHNFLNLTPEQQAQLKQIRESTRSQIDAVLTPEQKAQLQQMHANRQMKPGRGNGQANGQGWGDRPNGGKPGLGINHDADFQRGPFAALNLTADQRTRIQAIMQSSKQQMDAVLTPEQKAKLQQMRQQWQQRRQSGAQSR